MTQRSTMARSTTFAVLAGVVALPAWFAHAQSTDPALVAMGGSDTMQVIPRAEALDRPFRPLYAERPNGPRLTALEGDPATEASVTLFRYSRDYTNSGGLHYHTHAYRLWVIEGELKHWGEGGSEESAAILPSGSYLYQPADELHAANCITEQCTAYVIFDGPIQTGLPGR